MTRRFRPWDAPRIRRARLLPKLLDLESLIIDGGSPVRLALQAALHPGRGVVTLVLPAASGHGLAGYAQARRRVDPAEADVTWLAPDAALGAALGWSRLLGELSQALGAAGTQRIFVTVAVDDAVTTQVFRQLGYVAYCDDAVFRCRDLRTAAPADAAALTIVDEQAPQRHDIKRLLADQLPEAAVSAQGGDDWETYPAGGWAPHGDRRRVWLDKRGTVLGAWRIIPGVGGLWLRLVTATPEVSQTLARLATADALAAFGPDQPLYSSVRQHEAPLAEALAAAGYEVVARRRRLVKHTTARVLAPRWRQHPAAEAIAEPSAGRPSPARDSIHSAHRSGPDRPRSTP